MADLIVIYDPIKEIAAIVNPDTRVAFGPAMIGDGAGLMLTGFLTSMPYDVDTVDSATLRGWFEQFAANFQQAVEAQALHTESGAVESGGSTTMADVALAEREAAENAGQPPAPAPADADTEAAPAPAAVVSGADTMTAQSAPVQPPPAAQVPVRCFACAGAGVVTVDPAGPPVPCNVCNGTGRVMGTPMS